MLKSLITAKKISGTEFFKAHADCPTCRQGIADGHRTKIITETDKKLFEIQQGKQKIAEEVASNAARLTVISGIQLAISNKQTQVNTNQIQVAAWEKFVEDIKKEVMKKYKKEIDNCKNDLEFMENTAKCIFRMTRPFTKNSILPPVI